MKRKYPPFALGKYGPSGRTYHRFRPRVRTEPWPGLSMNTLVPLLDLCPYKEFSSFGSGILLRSTASIPGRVGSAILLRPYESIPGLVSRKIPCTDKSLRNHHGNS